MAGSTTLRFPDALKEEAQAYADALGISLNGLCAVALRDYLDARKPGSKTAKAAQLLPPARGAKAGATTLPARPPKSVQPVGQSGDEVVKVGLGEALIGALPPVRRSSKKRRKR